jgi:CTP synthase
VYWNVLTRERAGGYDGRNIQLIPEVVDEVKRFLASDIHGEDFVIYEAGGTIGDDEGFVFIEGIRQFINSLGRENAMLIHLTFVPFFKASGEVKTKPTQQSVRLLLEKGLSPNLILCRSESYIPAAEKRKISMFCNVAPEDVISAPDVKNVYEIPLVYHREGLDDRVLRHFGLSAPAPDLSAWEGVAKSKPARKATVGIVAKYCGFPDAYKSLVEAVHHAGIANGADTQIRWVNAEDIGTNGAEGLAGLDAVIVPGGFGPRGIEGKIAAAGYARTHNIPYLGICLGMQVAAIEMARNLLGITNANSTEFDKDCTPIIHYMGEFEKDGKIEKRREGDDIGGTMRLGAFPTMVAEGTLAHRIYGATEISERHRHRYEMDMSYEKALAEKGVIVSGRSPDGKLPEIIEIPGHKFFIAGQFHPEFKSRPFRAHPLFAALVKAAME